MFVNIVSFYYSHVKSILIMKHNSVDQAAIQWLWYKWMDPRVRDALRDSNHVATTTFRLVVEVKGIVHNFFIFGQISYFE